MKHLKDPHKISLNRVLNLCVNHYCNALKIHQIKTRARILRLEITRRQNPNRIAVPSRTVR
jgi:hypothetical protein